MDRDRRTTWLRRLRRTLRVAGRVVLWAMAVVVVLLAVVLLPAPSRRALLHKGLEMADEALPGRLIVARSDWPGLGRLELDGIVWTDGADTLASADTLRLQVDVSDLLRRDVTVRRVLAAGLRADVPAIMERLPAAPVDTAAATRATEPAAPPPFPRQGALPPLPSLAVERLAVRDAAATVAPGQVVYLDSLTAGVDLRHGRRPRFEAVLRARPLHHLGVAWRLAGDGDADTLALALAPLHIDDVDSLPEPGALPLTGRLALPVALLDTLAAGRAMVWPALALDRLAIAGVAGDWTVDARLDGRRPGRLAVESTMPEAPRALLTALAVAGADTLAPGLLDTLDARWGSGGDPGLHLRIDLEPPPEPAPPLASRLTVDGDLRLPAPATLAPLLPPQLITDDLGPILVALDLGYDGRVDPPTFTARLDLGATGWIDALLVSVTGDTTAARLDSLHARLPGIALTGSGAVDRDSLHTRLNLAIADASLLDRWREPRAGALDLQADFSLDLAAAWPLALEPAVFDPTDPVAMMPAIPARVAFVGSLHLPPPAILGPLLPPQLVVDDLGPVDAVMNVHYDGLAGAPRYAVRLDLGGTEWLDALQLSIRGDTTSVHLDSLTVRVPGLDLVADGVADRERLRLDLQLDLPDSTLLTRWRDPALDDIRPRASVTLDADGAWPVPALELAADLALDSPQVTVPALTVAATVAADTLLLDLDLPQGLSTPAQDLTSAAFSFDGAAADTLQTLRGHIRTHVDLPRAGLRLDGRLDARHLATAPAGTLAADTLAVRLGRRGFASTAPWRMVFDAADSLVTITDLDLAGDLGSLDLDAAVSPDSLAADLDLALQVAMDVIASLVPPAAANLLPTGTVTLDGRVDAAGSPAAPWVAAGARFAFADNPDLAGLSLDTHVTVGGSGEPPAAMDAGRAGWHDQAARLDVALSDSATTLMRIRAMAPLPTASGADSVDLRLDADGMDLARLEPLLPPGTSLTGRLDADTRIAGVMEPDDQSPDLDLSGGLRLTDLRLGAPDGSWMSMHGNVSLDGTSLSPVIKGGLDIEGGLIRVPEPPPSLLPDSGEALLWQAAAEPDTLAAALADTTPDGPPLPAFVPELTFTINCPGSLWLRGQGLDVELSGDLALHLRDGRPAIEGELEARQGTMQTLGRVFTLERGRIIFYADEKELNPELDLRLGVRIGSYEISIELTGTANEPELEFSSSPDLSEGDIVSVLLFGKTGDELSEGQSGLMAERAAQVAAAYGTAQLQENLAKELGVDVLSVAPSADDASKSALTVGKYLNPKVMVSYEQVLDEDSAFYVHLDYSLTPNQEWKLHTQVSQGEDSGVEIKWEKEW